MNRILLLFTFFTLVLSSNLSEDQFRNSSSSGQGRRRNVLELWKEQILRLRSKEKLASKYAIARQEGSDEAANAEVAVPATTLRPQENLIPVVANILLTLIGYVQNVTRSSVLVHTLNSGLMKTFGLGFDLPTTTTLAPLTAATTTTTTVAPASATTTTSAKKTASAASATTRKPIIVGGEDEENLGPDLFTLKPALFKQKPWEWDKNYFLVTIGPVITTPRPPRTVPTTTSQYQYIKYFETPRPAYRPPPPDIIATLPSPTPEPANIPIQPQVIFNPENFNNVEQFPVPEYQQELTPEPYPISSFYQKPTIINGVKQQQQQQQFPVRIIPPSVHQHYQIYQPGQTPEPFPISSLPKRRITINPQGIPINAPTEDPLVITTKFKDLVGVFAEFQ